MATDGKSGQIMTQEQKAIETLVTVDQMVLEEINLLKEQNKNAQRIADALEEILEIMKMK